MRVFRHIMTFLVVLIFFSAVPVLAEPSGQVVFIINETSYYKDGRAVTIDASPFIKDSRAFVPVRYLASALGVPSDKIIWSPSNQSVTLIKEGVSVVMKAGEYSIHINGRQVAADVAPVVSNGRTYLPARYVAEAFGFEVGWDCDNRAILIGPPGQLPESPPVEEKQAEECGPVDLREVEQALFSQINKDRITVGLLAVAWDETAATASRGHASEMAQNNYLSHWNLNGKKPQQRYTEAGGRYATTENAGYYWFENYELSLELVRDTVLELHDQMMAETPPDDSHRANILDPRHTHVGVGVAWAWYSDDVFVVAFTQEFTKHYAELTGVPPALRPGESFTVYGRVFKPGFKVTSVALFREEGPRPTSLEELRIPRLYSSPGLDDLVSYALEGWPDVVYPNDAASGGKLEADEQDGFSATLQAGAGAGLYYLQVRLKDAAGGIFVANELVIEVR